VNKEKFYAVKHGRVLGVYKTYTECQQQVKGFSNAVYRSFATQEEAEAFIREYPSQTPEGKHYDIFTGGSFTEGHMFMEPRYSWAFVVYEAGRLIHKDSAKGMDKESVKNHQGIVGEIEAVIKAVTWAEVQTVPITIHYSFAGIADWVLGAWKVNDKFSQRYVEFIETRKEWVKFNKVSAHSGIEGNEKAKKLARKVLKG